MTDINKLITDNINVWSSAVQNGKNTGRGKSKKRTLQGVKKLRELILELAVHGKLVPQNNSNEKASKLLDKITREKQELIKNKLIKKSKTLPVITQDEEPFSLPDSWVWCRLQDLSSYIQRGKGPKYDDNGKVKVISQKCIQWSGFDIEPARFVNDESLEKYQEERFLQQNDLLWNSTGTGTVGRINVLGEIACKSLVADSHVTIIRSLLPNPHFISIYISAPGIQLRIEPEHENALVSGSTKQVELNTSVVTSLEVPLPPLEEQSRIVAKVEELMALCDQLEQQTETNIGAHQLLVEELLSTLTNSKNAQEFEQNWSRIAEHFDLLLTTEHSIEQLKQTILQLAVMGKLVSQDPIDEPASKLLEKLAEQKEQLIKDKVIKKQKRLPNIEGTEPKYQLPKGWSRCYLSDAIDVRDGTHDSPKDAVGENTYPLVTSKNFIDGEIDFESARRISSEDHHNISKRSLVEKDDILFSMIGGNIGNQVQVNVDIPFSIKNVALFKYFNKEVTHPKFFKIYTDELAIELQNQASGGAQPFVSLGALRKLELFLPPIAEQKKIVECTERLIDVCNQLKKKVQEANAIQVNLSVAIVESALD
jgi:type I restriction enzyme S subunit